MRRNQIIWPIAVVAVIVVITLAVVGVVRLLPTTAAEPTPTLFAGEATAVGSLPTPTSAIPAPATIAAGPTATAMSGISVCQQFPAAARLGQQPVDESSPFYPVLATDHVEGPETAAITLIKYSDFQCPVCASIAPVLAQLKAQYPDDVRVIYRHFPLTEIHDKAALAAEATEAAAAQGQFWPMHDLLFARFNEWTALTPEEFRPLLSDYAAEIGLDVAAFDSALDSGEYTAKVQADREAAIALGLPGTPAIAINGLYSPDLPINEFTLNAIVKLELLRPQQFASSPPQILTAEGRYQAVLQLGSGDVRIDLFADRAPVAVNNFAFLACNGWYDNTTFHRVLPGFVAQGGDPTGTGFGGPGYQFANEISANLTFDRPGLLAYANSGPGTNGSQFFITYDAVPGLNGNFTIFGEVVAGYELVQAITPRDPQIDPLAPAGDRLLSVDIIEAP